MNREDLIALIKMRDANTVHGALGIRIEAFGAEETVVGVDVSERLFQHAGVVHGGVYVLLAESAASIAAALSVDMERFDVAGMEINANHLKKVTSGTLRATARRLHRGRSSMVFGIEVTDSAGEKICLSRCTIAIRERSFPDV